jgi:hypothetical protein
MGNEARDKTLNTNEQSRVSYKYDCYSGAQISLFVDGIWMDDAVAISFTLSNPKSPVYGYNSQYYDLVAQGNKVVQGQLIVAYTEEGYLTSIMAQRYKNIYGTTDIVDPTESSSEDTTAVSGSPLSSVAQAVSGKGIWTANTGLDTSKLLRINDDIRRLEVSTAAGTATTAEANQLQALRNEQSRLTQMSLGQTPPAQTYTRQTVQDIVGDLRGSSNYEDLVELMEDSLLDPAKLAAIKTKYPWVVVKGYGGKEKLRKSVDFDQVTGGTREKVPYTHIGDGFDITLTYGDMSVGSAEHTIKTITDVHFTSESQVIEANGNPIMEVLQFFARDLGDQSNLYAPGQLASDGNMKANATKNPTGAAKLDDTVVEIVGTVRPYLASGVPGASTVTLSAPVIEKGSTTNMGKVNVAWVGTTVVPIYNSYDRELIDPVNIENVTSSYAYKAVFGLVTGQVWATLVGTPSYGYYKDIQAVTKRGVKKLLYTDESEKAVNTSARITQFGVSIYSPPDVDKWITLERVDAFGMGVEAVGYPYNLIKINYVQPNTEQNFIVPAGKQVSFTNYTNSAPYVGGTVETCNQYVDSYLAMARALISRTDTVGTSFNVVVNAYWYDSKNIAQVKTISTITIP